MIEGNTVKVALDKVPGLVAVGGSVKVIDSRLPTSIIIARKGESDYAVVSLLCPHRGVEVEYQHEEKVMRCQPRPLQVRYGRHASKGAGGQRSDPL